MAASTMIRSNPFRIYLCTHTRNICPAVIFNSWRFYTARPPPERKPNFFTKFIDNVKNEVSRDRTLQESLKKIDKEAERLENNEALKKAREKFESVGADASRGTEVLKGKLGTIKTKVSDVIEEAGKTEFAKKAGQFTEEFGKSAKGAAGSIAEKSQRISQTGAFKAISSTAEAVKQELKESRLQGRVYRSPAVLRKRKETNPDFGTTQVYEPNLHATGVELHKDSKFYQSWENFKDKNPYVNKVLDWKMKFDESDNPVIRASRLLTDKVSDIMGGLFQKTELSEALTEIIRSDPSFDKAQFLLQCERDILPNILEAMVRGDMEVLRDWCYEAPFNVLSTPIKQAKSQGYVLDSQVLDIDHVELAMGKVIEQGPVLVLTFVSQQIVCLRDRTGKVIEGDPEKVLRVYYVWVLCRDQTELDPRAAWRLLDLSATTSEQFL